jgi:sulfiredoxin
MRNVLQEGVDLTAIEVAWVERPEGNYYFAFGGCHRWEAHKRLQKQTIKAKLVKVSDSTISTYLGSSSPFRKRA